MTEDKSEAEREHQFEDLIRESEDIKQDVDEVLEDVSRRLDALTRELRRRGAFPIASQISRHRPERDTASYGR